MQERQDRLESRGRLDATEPLFPGHTVSASRNSDAHGTAESAMHLDLEFPVCIIGQDVEARSRFRTCEDVVQYKLAREHVFGEVACCSFRVALGGVRATVANRERCGRRIQVR